MKHEELNLKLQRELIPSMEIARLKELRELKPGKIYTLELDISNRRHPDIYLQKRKGEINEEYEIVGTRIGADKCHISIQRRRLR